MPQKPRWSTKLIWCCEGTHTQFLLFYFSFNKARKTFSKNLAVERDQLTALMEGRLLSARQWLQCFEGNTKDDADLLHHLIHKTYGQPQCKSPPKSSLNLEMGLPEQWWKA